MYNVQAVSAMRTQGSLKLLLD